MQPYIVDDLGQYQICKRLFLISFDYYYSMLYWNAYLMLILP